MYQKAGKLKHLIIIILLPFLIFAKSSIFPDSATVIQKAVKNANDDWKNGNAYYWVPNNRSFKCLIDSATGLRYVSIYSRSNITRWDHLRYSKYMEELLRLCNTKGLPSNNYRSIRDLICDPREFVSENLDSKVQVTIDEKKSIRHKLNNSNKTYFVEFYYASKDNDEMTLSFYNEPSNSLPLGILEKGSILYYLSGPEDIGYFIIMNKKHEINSIHCLDMKKQDLLSRTHNKAM